MGRRVDASARLVRVRVFDLGYEHVLCLVDRSERMEDDQPLVAGIGITAGAASKSDAATTLQPSPTYRMTRRHRHNSFHRV